MFVNLFKELPSEKFNAFVGIEFLFSKVNTVNHGDTKPQKMRNK